MIRATRLIGAVLRTILVSVNQVLMRVAATLLWPFEKLITPQQFPLWTAALYTTKFVLTWVIAWAIQWHFAPSWFVDSRAGLQTVFQVLPASLVALLVFVLGALFVVAQISVTSYGTRAALLLITDAPIRGAVIRPLTIAAVALLLSGQIPDVGSPSPGITSAAATLVLATVWIVVSSGLVVTDSLVRYTAPVVFAQQVIDEVQFYVESQAVGVVKYRVALLGDMARMAIRRGDSTSLSAAMTGMRKFQQAYIDAVQATPDSRRYTFDDGQTVDGWLGHDLASAIGGAVDDVLAHQASEIDYELASTQLCHAAEEFVRADLDVEAQAMVDALISSGTSIHQISTSGAVNIQARASDGLASVVRIARERGLASLAAWALAGWCVVQSYAQTHFGLEHHPRWEVGLEDMGDDPQWHEAADLIVLPGEFAMRWFNKMPGGYVAVIGTLAQSEARHAEQRGLPPPVPPAVQST